MCVPKHKHTSHDKDTELYVFIFTRKGSVTVTVKIKDPNNRNRNYQSDSRILPAAGGAGTFVVGTFDCPALLLFIASLFCYHKILIVMGMNV